MITMGLDRSGDIYIVDIHRERYEFPDLKRKMIMLNNQWRGKGLRGIYIEDKASGQSLIQELKRESGVSVIPYRISTDKVTPPIGGFTFNSGRIDTRICALARCFPR